MFKVRTEVQREEKTFPKPYRKMVGGAQTMILDFQQSEGFL